MNQWIEIPGGQVTMLEGGYISRTSVFDVAPFAMAQFPVTNEAYGRFVAANGYQTRQWWSKRGWRAKEKGHWVEPRHWYSPHWHVPDHPIVGVCWYEAMAYCRWLSAETGQTITLPTEQQWQRAAQGDDGRLYPWGSEEPSADLCNWSRNVDETTPVHKYPAGASPFGVMDMCGNVLEWTLTAVDVLTDGRDHRLLRGGSWSSESPLSLRVTNRSPRDPNTNLLPTYRDHVTVGFRCVKVR
jgi:formylglycine-generating enzyme required for sulfatase activity